MEKAVLDKITQSMDKVILKFKEDNEIIFDSPQERKKLKYAIIQDLKDWERSNICIFDGCSNKSIQRSHTIQKSASIKAISENGHTIRPYFHADKEEMVAELIGDNEASTFPGFCELHEKLFEDFETKKTLESSDHFRLQIYRTICREIVRKQADILGLQRRLKQYVEHRDKRISELIQKELGEEFITTNDITFNSTTIKFQDSRKHTLDEHIKNGKSDLNNFLVKFKDGILKDIIQKKNHRIYGHVIKLDTTIAVALAGRGNFHTGKKNINVIINVLPFDTETIIVTSGLAKDKKEIEHYMGLFSDPLNIINLVENWMVHGSDHWFVRPSVWNAIKQKHQAKILTDIHDLSRNIGRLYELSIFNNLKRQIIKLLTDNFDTLTDGQKRIIEMETPKLTD